VPVPDHSSAEPTVLEGIAQGVCPGLVSLETFADLGIALESAIATEEESAIVLCGSLYLVGHFLGTYGVVDL
jgi:dihydrofolate synthase/folylpolyglutamate synthase